MTPAEKAKITRQHNTEIKARQLRILRKQRLADLIVRLEAFAGVRKLVAINKMADDERGDANVRAVAVTMSKKFQSAANEAKTLAAKAIEERPRQPWEIPRTREELMELRRKVTEARKAKRKQPPSR